MASRLRIGSVDDFDLLAEAAEPGRADEVQRLRIALDHLPEREPVLAQGEVERRRLVGPAPVVARRLALRRRAREQVELAEQLAGLTQRRRAREVVYRPRVAVGDVVEDVVDDVLADPLLAFAAQVDDRRGPRELAVLAVVAGELVLSILIGSSASRS